MKKKDRNGSAPPPPIVALLALLLLAGTTVVRAFLAVRGGAVVSGRRVSGLLRAPPSGVLVGDGHARKTAVKIEASEAGASPFVIAWLALLLLAGVSTGSAFLGIGAVAPIIEFGVAALQAATLFIVFMRLKGPPSLKWIVAGIGFFWLLFLFGLSMTDYASRHGWPSQ